MADWAEKFDSSVEICDEIAVHVREIIAPAYYDLHLQLKNLAYAEYWLKGG